MRHHIEAVLPVDALLFDPRREWAVRGDEYGPLHGGGRAHEIAVPFVDTQLRQLFEPFLRQYDDVLVQDEVARHPDRLPEPRLDERADLV